MTRKPSHVLAEPDSDDLDKLDDELSVSDGDGSDSEETENMNLGLEKRRSTIIQKLGAAQVAEKMKAFSRGKQEKDGKLVKDEDDEKEELEAGIIMKAINKIGGKAFWFAMFTSYACQSLWHKSMDYKLKNMS